MKYLSILIIGAALITASCKAQNKSDNGFTKLDGGLEYKTLVKGNSDKTVNIGDIAELRVIMLVADSVMMNSDEMNNGQPIEQEITPSQMKGDLMGGLLKMHPGDSTVFRMDLDTISARTNQPRPEWAKEGKAYVEWVIKMNKITTKEEHEHEMAEAQSKQEQTDDALIQKYLKDHNITNFQKTANGLYYVINKEGSGEKPQAGQTVTVNYTGTLLSGEKFDSNTDPAFNHVEPFQFPLGQHRVIQGWDEGVALMSKGEKATFYIPSKLAYGARGAGPKIGPNSVLIFDVEVVDFK